MTKSRANSTHPLRLLIAIAATAISLTAACLVWSSLTVARFRSIEPVTDLFVTGTTLPEQTERSFLALRAPSAFLKQTHLAATSGDFTTIGPAIIPERAGRDADGTPIPFITEFLTPRLAATVLFIIAASLVAHALTGIVVGRQTRTTALASWTSLPVLLTVVGLPLWSAIWWVIAYPRGTGNLLAMAWTNNLTWLSGTLFVALQAAAIATALHFPRARA